MTNLTNYAADCSPTEPIHAVETYEPISIAARVGTIAAICIPLLGIAATPFVIWGWGFGWVDLGLLLGMYFVTAIGITVGFHRLFVHRSFETYWIVKSVLAILGSMAVQGSLMRWAAQHRRHHQHSDADGDPHSPHHHGNGIVGVFLGFWHAHIGWAFKRDKSGLDRYIPDLRASRTLRAASALFPMWILLGLAIPAALGGLITGTWAGAWTGLIWGGIVRVFLVHHVTWSVNSACHLWGRRPYQSEDQSRNNFVFGILAMGEGWHNSHHAFPTSARHGLRWWEIDVSYLMIRALALMGLATSVRVPTKELQERKRVRTRKQASERSISAEPRANHRETVEADAGHG